MTVRIEPREGMPVFDPSGHRLGHVESVHAGHFFLTHTSAPLPLAKERIVVNAADSVERVDGSGVHLKHDRQDLLARQMRPPESKNLRQVSPGEDVSHLHRGDEERRERDRGDSGELRPGSESSRTGLGSTPSGS